MSMFVEGGQGFRVELVNPHQTFLALQSSLPVLEVNPFGVGDSLSNTFFENGKLFYAETTAVDLDNMMGYPSYRFSSILLTHPYEWIAPYAFYSPERVVNIQEILQTYNERVRLNNSDYKTGLEIDCTRKSFIAIDFGYKSLEVRGKFQRDILQRQTSPEQRKKRFEHVHRLLEEGEAFQNEAIIISLEGKTEEGYIHPLEFGDEQEFLKNIRLYARKYETILRALYQERGILQPNISITLEPPGNAILIGIKDI